MTLFIELIKTVLIGIVQGITEWLPVSSTGHMILLDELIKLNISDEVKELFMVVIQLGSILAVLCLYFSKLNPFSRTKGVTERKNTLHMWGCILIACIPAGVIGVLFDDFFDEHFYNYPVVGAALFVYGIAFIVIERAHKNKKPKIESAELIDCKTALLIGAFQTLSLIPGTSRSGSTIIGGMLLGVSRTAAAEFSFFLAIPVMLGASALKCLKYFAEFGLALTGTEWLVIAVGSLVAFLVSLFALRFLVGFVRRHSFEAFGWYRIALGVTVFVCFAVKCFA